MPSFGEIQAGFQKTTQKRQDQSGAQASYSIAAESGSGVGVA